MKEVKIYYLHVTDKQPDKGWLSDLAQLPNNLVAELGSMYHLTSTTPLISTVNRNTA